MAQDLFVPYHIGEHIGPSYERVARDYSCDEKRNPGVYSWGLTEEVLNTSMQGQGADKEEDEKLASLTCSSCSSEFATRGSLNTHIRRYHPSNPLDLQCDYCQKKLKNTKTKKDHERRCPQCM